MVETALVSKWTPTGFLRRLRRVIRRPGDLVFALRIGYFLWRFPKRLTRVDLTAFLRELRFHPPGPGNGIESDVERITRLRQAWLRRPFFCARNTCYTRALTLYRFLDPGDKRLSIHLGVEESPASEERVRGHAWVSLNGVLLEPVEPVAQGQVREIFRYPPGE